MSELRMPKVLGQLAPAAVTWEMLYGVAGERTADVQTLTVCNRSGSARTFRVYIALAAAEQDVHQALYHDKSIAANDSLILTLAGLRLARFDEIWVYASTADLTFQAFGVESA